MIMFGFFKKKTSEPLIEKSIEEFKKVWETDINSIWEISNINEFITAMYGWLCRKCDYGDNIESLSVEERVFFVSKQLEDEVNNGGFSQFLYNSSGNFANEGIPSLLAIGAVQTAEICKEAFAAIGERIPNRTEEREALLDHIMTDDVEKKLSKCDVDFYEYSDTLEKLHYQFIVGHKKQFS